MNPLLHGRPALLLSTLVVLLSACGKNTAPPITATPITVEFSKVQAAPLQDVLELDGVVAPSQSVNLVARVAGMLEQIHFADGDVVHRGQVLFTLEQGSWREQVKLNRARVEQSRSDYERQTQLLKENAGSQANVDVARSNLQQAEANLKLAEINLSYTEIRSPFDGVMGRHQVDVGNYVGSTAGGTVLGTVLQLAPAYVNAAVGERDALRLRGKTTLPRGKHNNIVVHARLQDQNEGGESGTLDFIDRQFAAGTGTLALRGRFSNTDYHLIPGFYAKLIIDIGAKRRAILVPRAAVQSDQQGEFVFIVDKDQTARRRKVTTVTAPGENREVSSGLSEGERLVVAGYAKLSDGVAVQSVEAQSVAAQPFLSGTSK